LRAETSKSIVHRLSNEHIINCDDEYGDQDYAAAGIYDDKDEEECGADIDEVKQLNEQFSKPQITKNSMEPI